MAYHHLSQHRRMALLSLSFAALSCSMDRNIVAIVETSGGSGAAVNGSGHAGTGSEIAGGMSSGGTTGGTSGARTVTEVAGGALNGSNGGTPNGGTPNGGTPNGGTPNGGTPNGGTNTTTAQIAGSGGNSTVVLAFGSSSGGPGSSFGGRSSTVASGGSTARGGSLVQGTDFSTGGSLGTLVFVPEPNDGGNSTDICFCVMPDGPTLCTLEDTTDYPVCGEGCVQAAPGCVGSCPCSQPPSGSITFQAIECLNHGECGFGSACLVAENASTQELIASHCL